jgi:phytoene desaturase
MLLARAGLAVRVIERLPRVGGRCSAVEAGGFRFDLGPTFFLYPTILERIFRLVGRDLRADVPMVRLDPQYRIVFGSGGDLLCSPDLARMEAEVRKFSAADAGNVRRFIAENRTKMERFRPCLERAFLGWGDVFRLGLLKLLPLLRPWNTLDAELNRYFSDPRVRLAFSFQSKYLGMSPFNCPSLFSILSYLEYDYGVWHPIGGCSAVSEAMARVAAESGVTISLGEDVEGLLLDGRRAVGVRSDRGEYLADAVVVNADFARAMTRLVPDAARWRWRDAAIGAKKFSCSTFMMYLGIEGRYDDLPHHTVYTAADYVSNLRDIETAHRLSADPSFYVQNACVSDETLAPRGMSTLYVLAPVTHVHPNVDWAIERDRFREVMLRQLAKVGVSDLGRRIRYERIVTPADWQDRYEVFRGATFNLAHSLDQMLHFRPRNRFEDLDGVYLVGGGTHPGSGLPVIYESARISSRLLLTDLGRDAGWLDRAETGHGAVPVTR